MTKTIFPVLHKLPKPVIVILAITFSIFIGYVDSFIGHKLVVSLFYFLPIGFAAWYGGKKPGLLVVAVIGCICLFVEYNWLQFYDDIFFVYWNTIVRVTLFLIICYLVSSLKSYQDSVEEKVKIQTQALTEKIEHQVKTEEALLRSEKRYRQVVESAIEIIYSADLEGNFTYANNAALETSGFSIEEFTKLNFEKLVTPGHRNKVINFYLRQYAEKNSASYFEFPFVTRSGDIKWLGQNTLLVYEEDKIKGFHMIARDITDRIAAQEALEASEIKFRNLAKTAPIALTRMNLTTSTYDFVNDEFIRQSGYTQEEFEKLTEIQLVEMIYPEDRERVFNTYRVWQEEGYKGLKHIDYRIVNKKKEIIWLDTFIYSDINDKGEIISINQIAMDMTEQKLLQQSFVESDERYRAFIEHSAEGIYRIEFDKPISTDQPYEDIARDLYKNAFIAECNLAFAKMYRYDDTSAMIGKRLLEVHGGEIRQSNIDAFTHFFVNGYRINNEETHEYDRYNKVKYFLNSAVGTVSSGYLLRIWGTQIDITEQKAILEQNRKLSQAVEQSSASIAIIDVTGVVEYVNRRYIETTQYSSEEAVGAGSKILDQEYEIDGDKLKLLNYVGSGHEWSGEFLAKRKNGEEYWEYVRMSPIKNSSGAVTHIITISEDINEQKSAEDSIRKSEERYRAFIAQSSEGIYRMELTVPLNINSSIEEHVLHFAKYAYLAECNDVMAKMYGYNVADEVLGLSVVKLLSEKQQVAGNTISFELFIRAGYRINNSQTKEVNKDGSVNYFLNNGIGIIENGCLVRLWGTQRDITQLKTIQEEIRKLSQAVEQSPDAVIITDTTGKIEYVNPRFTDVTGYGTEEVIGKTPYILMTNDLSDKSDEIWSTIKAGTDWKGEYYNQKKNGDRYWEYATISPIKDNDGITTHFVYVKEDITERKTFEIELVEAMQRAEEASKAKSQFLANMSHEIRTPMNGIVGMTQLLSLTTTTEEQAEYLDMIKYSSEILLKIINDILDFSRIESGNLNFNEKSFNIKELVINTCKIFKNDADKKKLGFEYEIDDKIDYHIVGDQYRVNQILINLINNAIKFTPKGEINIKLCQMKRNGDNADLRFEIADTGIGIPKDKFSRLFESFTQLENPYDKQYMGTGLGLSIVKRLVDLMHGEIELSSEPGKGSSFVIMLNFRIAEKELVNTADISA